MTKAKCEETKSRLVKWARQGGELRRRLAYVMLSLVLIYYHSIGRHLSGKEKQSAENVKQSAGNVKQSAENVKQSAGKEKQSAGKEKQSAGNVKQSAGNVKQSAENVKQSAESGVLHRVIQAVNLGVIIICLFLIAQEYYLTIEHRNEQKKLKAVFESAENVMPADMVLHPKTDALDAAGLGMSEKPSMHERLQKLYEENNDLAAWISIEGTGIDYPVMQCGDDEYYLHHDFYGNEDKYGCLYVRNRADVNDGDNFIIYGHNMQDGTMLGNLDSYREESFYSEHPTISFYTLRDDYTYEIIAVFLSQVYTQDDDTFKYYQFYEADTKDEFDYFYKNIKELSMYDTGINAEFGDKLLTLSTCAYHVDDGRFVVVAKRTEK